MKGLMIYREEDYERNSSFADWVVDECKAQGVLLHVTTISGRVLHDDICFADYDFIVNRTRDYNLSLMLELSGIPVFNNSYTTLLGNNKYSAYRYAQMRGYSIPKIVLSRGKEDIVVKPFDGHGGKEIVLTSFPKTLDTGCVYQEFVKDVEGDIRFYIIGNRIVNAVIRKPKNGFISNYSLGNDFEQYFYSAKEEALILDFIKDLTVDYAGIDFFRLKNNTLVFNEVEDVVGSRMLSALGINNTVSLWVQHIRRTIG